MKKFAIALGVVLLLLVGAVVALPLLVPAETIKDRVVAEVNKATGRTLTVAGPMSVTGFPSLGLELSDVALSNAPGGQAKDMVKLAGLSVQLKLLPLLSGSVEVDSFVLKQPQIALEVDRQGRPNWQFAPAAPASAPAAAKPAESAPASAGAGAGGGLADLKLGRVAIEDGRLTYVDLRSGARHELSSIGLALSLPGLDQPFAADGGLTWKGKALTLAAEVAKPRALLDGQSSALSLALKSEPVSLSFKGSASLAKALAAEGALDLSIPSVRGLAAWAGDAQLPAGAGFGPFTLAGKLAVAGDRYAVNDLTLAFDQIKGTGALSADLSGARPALKANLAVPMLDVTPYMGGGEPSQSGGQVSTGAAAPPSPAQQAKNGGGAGGWSDAPIDASGLRAVDADLTFAAEALKADAIEVGKSKLHLVLVNGRATTDIEAGQLYGGSGTLRAVVDGSRPGVGLDASWKIAGLQAEPFLKAAAGFDRISGTLAASGSLAGSGRSERALVSSLGGKGAVTFTDGAIKGINLAAMLRNVTTAFAASGEQQKTDFAELSGTWTMTQGILSNDDLSLQSPLLRVAGAGTVSLPPRTLDYRVEPRAVASIEGQGGSKDLAGITVPVIIDGSWDAPRFRPDLAGALQNNLKDPGKLLQGLTGKTSAPADGQQGQPALPINPMQLFGR